MNTGFMSNKTLIIVTALFQRPSISNSQSGMGSQQTRGPAQGTADPAGWGNHAPSVASDKWNVVWREDRSFCRPPPTNVACIPHGVLSWHWVVWWHVCFHVTATQTQNSGSEGNLRGVTSRIKKVKRAEEAVRPWGRGAWVCVCEWESVTHKQHYRDNCRQCWRREPLSFTPCTNQRTYHCTSNSLWSLTSSLLILSQQPTIRIGPNCIQT